METNEGRQDIYTRGKVSEGLNSEEFHLTAA